MGLPAIRRRRIAVDHSKLRRVQHALSARTATDAVDKALDQVLFGEEITTALRAVAGKGKRIKDVFGNLR
jgi:hypothetical protein